MLNKSEYRLILPKADLAYHPHLMNAMSVYGIDTPLRIAAFIAQIAHESGEFRWLKEIWGPTEQQRRYEGRQDLGNAQPGDGKRFMGRGVLQITGRHNYTLYSKLLATDFVNHPELLETPKYAFLSAACFWDKNKLNELADKGLFKLITKRINGGYNGYNERLKYYAVALKVLV